MLVSMTDLFYEEEISSKVHSSQVERHSEYKTALKQELHSFTFDLSLLTLL